MAELEARLIYAVIVAGKSADFADQVTAGLWSAMEERHQIIGDATPFVSIRIWDQAGTLEENLRDCRVGNYTKNTLCLSQLAQCPLLDLSTVSVEMLETFHGIGPKTSRFFVLWTRPWERYAALDTHILKWLNKQGIKAPKSTPTGKRYLELEEKFIAMADKVGLTPRELDYKIWQAAAGRTQEDSRYEGQNRPISP